jgi:hypothetical protein
MKAVPSGVLVFLGAIALVGCATPIQQHAEAAMVCEGNKDYRCAIENIDWILANGGDASWYMNRARVRLVAGDRAGAIEDANRAVDLEKNMGTLFGRALILGDLARVQLIGFADASASSSPPIDVDGAITDLTQCIAMVPANPSEDEESMLIQCLWARRELKIVTGQDYASDDATFRRLACQQCSRGKQCNTASGCSLAMPAPLPASGLGWSSSGESPTPSPGGAGGGWWYTRSCSGACAPHDLAVSDKAGPFANEEQCNAARSHDPHQQTILEPGNFGTLGNCYEE